MMLCLRTTCFVYAAVVPNRRILLTEFRSRLIEVIDRSGLNRSQFAEQNQIDRSTLSQLLSPANRRLPRLETLAAVANSQQVSIDWLVGLSSAGPMQAELIQERTFLEREVLGPDDERLIGWLKEATGYKIRYVPATLPDLLKTSEVILYELGQTVATSAQENIATSAARLAWTRGPGTDLEVCNSVQAVEGFARGEGIWRALDNDVRVAQLDNMIQLADELYPTLRWFLFDGLQRYAAPTTIFGPLRVALYIGQMYLVLTATEHINALTAHFDDLIRAAVVQPNEIPAFLKELRTTARRMRR